jgi:hypothetical protein
MGDAAKFEIVEDHEFKLKEKVLVIDSNGFDVWEAIITAINADTYKVHYPDYPQEDEELEGTSRILVETRINRRIFNAQEAERQTQLPLLGSSESEPFSEGSSSDDAEDYADTGSPSDAKKPRKGKALKKREPKPRPKGARVSPRRRR